MMRNVRTAVGIPFLCAALAFGAGCSTPDITADLPKLADVDLDPNRKALALREVAVKHATGTRVWCVPFARDLSGIEIRGNANTWWGQAEGQYARGQEPRLGAVMTWKATNRNPRGHVAVVSDVISDREIRVDHANWKRNRVSHQMTVIDVSDAGDWSAVKLESAPGSFGSVYPIKGFIYPNTGSVI